MASTPASRSFSSFICRSCRQRLLPATYRAFTTTSVLRAADSPPSPPRKSGDAILDSLSALSSSIHRSDARPRPRNDVTHPTTNPSYLDLLDGHGSADSLLSGQWSKNLDAARDEKPHRMHIYATKHNTHITLVQPPRSAGQTTSSNISGTSASVADQKKIVDVLLSLSAGNIGFRKAGRGSYDAAYQLAAFALKQMQEKGMLRDINKLEVVLRGFGAGREAVTKALLGAEGRNIRSKICAVVDATRLKIGGPRSPKPRRLG